MFEAPSGLSRDDYRKTREEVASEGSLVKRRDAVAIDHGRRRFLRHAVAGLAAVAMPRGVAAAHDFLSGSENHDVRNGVRGLDALNPDLARESREIDAENRALQERTREMVEDIAREYGITVRFGSRSEMVQRSNADAAYTLLDALSKDATLIGRDVFRDIPESMRGDLLEFAAQYRDGDDATRTRILQKLSELFARDAQGGELVDVPISAREKFAAVQGVHNALRLYPKDLVRTLAAGGRLSIVLTKSGEDGAAAHAGGSAVSADNAGGAQGLYSGTIDDALPRIFIDIMQSDADPELTVRARLVHELHHRVDHIFGGDANKLRADNPQWDDLVMREDAGGELRGAASEYGASHVAENAAEIARLLFTPESYALLGERLKDGDSNVLRENIKTIMAQYWNISGGLMDEEYWRRLSGDGIEAAQEYIAAREEAASPDARQ